jgi:Glycosyl transferase family 2
MSNNTFSVIIPTLWKSKQILSLIDQLTLCKNVKEIIIIDNNGCNSLYKKNLDKNDKIKILIQEKNIFVNPSWNLGVSKSTGENIALCNDDVSFSTKIFDDINVERGSLYGPHTSCYNLQKDGKYEFIKDKNINYGFGCLLFFNKKDYVPIPEDLKVFFGDNFLIEKFQYVYKIYNLAIHGEMSVSSREFENVMEQEKNIFDKIKC